jgi:hypothetical protein
MGAVLALGTAAGSKGDSLPLVGQCITQRQIAKCADTKAAPANGCWPMFKNDGGSQTSNIINPLNGV